MRTRGPCRPSRCGCRERRHPPAHRRRRRLRRPRGGGSRGRPGAPPASRGCARRPVRAARGCRPVSRRRPPPTGPGDGSAPPCCRWCAARCALRRGTGKSPRRGRGPRPAAGPHRAGKRTRTIGLQPRRTAGEPLDFSGRAGVPPPWGHAFRCTRRNNGWWGLLRACRGGADGVRKMNRGAGGRSAGTAGGLRGSVRLAGPAARVIPLPIRASRC